MLKKLIDIAIIGVLIFAISSCASGGGSSGVTTVPTPPPPTSNGGTTTPTDQRIAFEEFTYTYSPNV